MFVAQNWQTICSAGRTQYERGQWLLNGSEQWGQPDTEFPESSSPAEGQWGQPDAAVSDDTHRNQSANFVLQPKQLAIVGGAVLAVIVLVAGALFIGRAANQPPAHCQPKALEKNHVDFDALKKVHFCEGQWMVADVEIEGAMEPMPYFWNGEGWEIYDRAIESGFFVDYCYDEEAMREDKVPSKVIEVVKTC